MNTATIPTSEGAIRDPSARARRVWAGRALSTLLVLMLSLSASLKLAHVASFAATWTEHLGYAEGTLTSIGILELLCVALYVAPRTSVLGAILVTAYLGGAVATHVRVGDPFVIPIVLGIVAWLGLYLRDDRLRALTPLRTLQSR